MNHEINKSLTNNGKSTAHATYLYNLWEMWRLDVHMKDADACEYHFVFPALAQQGLTLIAFSSQNLIESDTDDGCTRRMFQKTRFTHPRRLK
ncbi:hypothetical protein AVEN_171841-1 [Araneus ventricosus]|uniref:Uncharacterized protein n=1 Tax=Araneus ventricosus TaxID=182803 RepID=A0A4Y2F584_ARAVE|nr:hypothetical protein AVEN_171841-1 [Araneus ventricosus]